MKTEVTASVEKRYQNTLKRLCFQNAFIRTGQSSAQSFSIHAFDKATNRTEMLICQRQTGWKFRFVKDKQDGNVDQIGWKC